eukprot:TRINITY_DN11813_c0_g1_i1.p1 TRINITY_DN11813_c0_g1~~TRINITY_DN11813_c0_g1_i1.p1  ORF type:complete len:285 (+),score=74.20 TRINITY_DN11813_c0_g1_i1:71-925(+)
MVRRPDDEEYVEVEGEAEEVDSDDSEDGLLGEACLPVDGAPLDPSLGPPQDADEYLRQVQWERLRCPEVVSASVEEQKPKKTKPTDKAVWKRGSLLANFGQELPQEATPCAEWTADAAQAFRQLRERVSLERRASEGRLERLKAHEWKERMDEWPSSDLLATHDFVSLNQLMVAAVEVVVDALEGNKEDAEEGDCSKPAEHPFASEDSKLAKWLFAALLHVEEPLFDDNMYQMQRLRRKCIKALIDAQKSEAPESSTVEGADAGPARSRAALFYVIVTEVFNQR